MYRSRLSRLAGLVSTALVLMGLGGHVVGCGPEADRPNILFVVLDTVRDDLDQLGDGGSASLRRLSAEATVFDQAYANAPWTVPSHASFFTGLLSSGHGCTHRHPRLDANLPTLAELLTEAGYSSAAFYSNPWLSDRTTALLRGFEQKQEAPLSGGLPGDPGRYAGDQGGRASVVNLRRWLRDRPDDQPFFAFVNLLEAHLPYDPPPDLRARLLPDLPADRHISGQWGMEYQAGLHPSATVVWDEVSDLYWGDVASVDRLLGGILDALTEYELDENTVLIVCSDHGENLGEHDLVDHQFSVHESLLAVPLLIRAPGRLAPSHRDDPVMLTDLYATLIEVAGVKGAPHRAFSRSLLGEPAPSGRPLLAEYERPQNHLVDSLVHLNPDLDRATVERALRTIRVGDLRLTLADDGETLLHDLRADPQQERDIAAERPQDVAALRTLLDQSLPLDRPGVESEIELDEATRQQLRSLGYVH